MLDIRLLLQVDDYVSYDLVARAQHLESVFRDKLSIKFHYKIFKNTSLQAIGKGTGGDDQTQSNEVYIDSDRYFVLESNSDKKSNQLFLETINQMCLENADRNMYHSYMKEVQSECFVITLPNYDYVPVDRFTDCSDQVLTGILGNEHALLQKVNSRE